MTTITIPKRFGYPTVDIYINGKKYTFNSGVKISVEEDIAAVVNNAVALEPKPRIDKSKIAQRVDGSLSQINTEDLKGISTISQSAFNNCNSLRKVFLPSSITTIMYYAFDWCTNLEGVYLPEKPPTLANVNAFGNIPKTCIFYCKTQASLDAYKVATNWSTLTGTYTFKVED